MTRVSRARLPLPLTVVAFVLLVCAPIASAMERVDLRDLSATRFSGMPTDDVAHDTRLYATRVGDVNGDGHADLAIGLPRGNGNLGDVVVLFGPVRRSSVSLAGPVRGFRILGTEASGLIGRAVAGGGDVNGDGLADVLVGAPLASSPGRVEAGAAFVVYGRRDRGSVELQRSGIGRGLVVMGTVGASASGASPGRLGDSVAEVGDVNGDGLADLALAAPYVGVIYVVFGRRGPGVLDTSAGSPGGYVIGVRTPSARSPGRGTSTAMAGLT